MFSRMKKEVMQKCGDTNRAWGETMDVEEEGEATGSGGPKFGGALSALVKLGGFIT